MGKPSSSAVLGMALVNTTDIGFSDQMAGPPKGFRSSAIRVVMLRAMMEGQSGAPPL